MNLNTQATNLDITIFYVNKTVFLIVKFYFFYCFNISIENIAFI